MPLRGLIIQKQGFKIEIKFSGCFRKQYDKASEKIRKAFRNRLNLFRQNPLDPQLRDHALKGEYKGYRSINVTGDWRAIYSKRKTEDDDVIVFELLGTHSQLYKN